MSNPGNTGQRYRLVEVVSVEAQGDKVTKSYDCGHSVVTTWNDYKGQSEEVAARSQNRVGKRERCMKCPPREAK